MGEVEAVVVHVQGQGQAVSEEGTGEKPEVRQQRFPFVQADGDVEASGIIEQVQQGEFALLA